MTATTQIADLRPRTTPLCKPPYICLHTISKCRKIASKFKNKPKNNNNYYQNLPFVSSETWLIEGVCRDPSTTTGTVNLILVWWRRCVGIKFHQHTCNAGGSCSVHQIHTLYPVLLLDIETKRHRKSCIDSFSNECIRSIAYLPLLGSANARFPCRALA